MEGQTGTLKKEQNQMKMIATATLLAVLLSGCASHPDDIPSEQVSAQPYKNLDCDGLEDALIRSSKALAEASKRQKNKRTWDGVSNVLLLPGVASLAKDSREAVARHKGEVEIITLELDSRRCEYDPVVVEIGDGEPTQTESDDGEDG